MKACIAVVCVVALVGCSPEPSPSAAPTPVPRSTDTGSFVNGGECPVAGAEGLPPDSGCVTTAGDLIVYARLGRDRRPASWYTRLGGIDRPLEAGNPFSYPRAIAELDVIGGARPEWLIKTFDLASHGTNWQQLGLFVLRGERLLQVTYDGEPFPIRVGGISRMGEGARCEMDALVILRTEASNRKNTRWSTSETRYRIEGSRAFKGSRKGGILRLRGYNDPKLDPFYRFGCEGFMYP